MNNEVITQKDLDDFLNFARMQLYSQSKDKKEVEEKITAMKQDILSRLIEDRLIIQEAKKENIKVDEARIKSKLDEVRNKYSSDEQFQDVLKQQGITQADLETRLREQFYLLGAIEGNIKTKISVNPSEVTEFYERNASGFTLPEQKEFEVASIKDERLAKQFIAQLKKGYDFKETAAKYNLSTSNITAAQDGQLQKDVEKAIFALKVGEFSLPIKIENLYYIFKVNQIVPPRQQTLNDVREQVYTFLYNQKLQQGMSAWVDELKKKSYIKIF